MSTTPVLQLPRAAPMGTITRRAAVVLLGLAWLLLASPLPTSLAGTGVALVALQVGIGVSLNQSTRWQVWRRPSRLDEREAQQRDRAYRHAFRGIGVGVFLLIVSGAVEVFFRPGYSQPLLAFDSGPRILAALVLLLALLPCACLAWSAAPRLRDQDSSTSNHRPPRSLLLALPVLAVVVTVGLWSALVTLLPARTLTVISRPSHSVGWGGAKCEGLELSRELGSGLGAALNLDTNVCFNGRRAWNGNQSFSRTSYLSARRPLAANCSPRIDATDFENVTGESCSERGTPDGTLRLVTRARVSATPGGWLRRTLTLTVLVTGHGKVLQPA
ncbi:MAG: hypothetical protein ACREN1_10430 [Candidatus Dormibacteria bacterium]